MRKLTAVIAVIVIVGLIGGGVYYFLLGGKDKFGPKNSTEQAANSGQLAYLSFDGSYYFDIPDGYSVDDIAVPGAQVIFQTSNPVQASTLDELYNSGAIAIQPISQVKSGDTAGFEKYVNETLTSDLKKNIAKDAVTNVDIKNGIRTATIQATKDGKVVRYMYAYDGRHPALLVANARTPNFDITSSSLSDIEDSPLGKDIDAIKNIIKQTVTELQQNKAHDIYTQSTDNLKKHSSESDVTKAIADASTYLKRNIVIPGVSVKGIELSTKIYMISPNKDEKITAGLLVFVKQGNNWKLDGFQLPSSTSTSPSPSSTK